MLRIITGPFHPDLERALVEEVQQLKAADPLDPVAVIVPSDTLKRRLKWLLCVERRLALLDVHFLTFYQLCVRLLQEVGRFDPSLRPDFFFTELVHEVLRQGAVSSEARSSDRGRQAVELSRWSALVDMPGAWGALLATLKDLKDAKVETNQALEALTQSRLDPDQAVRSLLVLYQKFQEEKARTQGYDHDDLAVQATEQVACSSFLARQRRILYYGFYDLTQIQLDLFQAVSRTYPTSVFFPLVKGHPAYAFAERFFERYLHGLTTEPVKRAPFSRSGSGRPSALSSLFDEGGGRVADGAGSPASGRADEMMAGPTSRIVSVSGRVDEVTIVAKDILGLVEERGYGFHEIGVTARTLTGYETVIPRVFTGHGIPLTSMMGRAVGEVPFIKAVIQLLDIRAMGFRRDHVISLLSSPFVRLLCPSGGSVRPDLWDVASRRLGITKGVEEWQRLTAFCDRDLPLRDNEEGNLTGPRIPARHIRDLWDAVSMLIEALSRLPDTATWDEYTHDLEALCARVLDPDAGDAAVNEREPVTELFGTSLEELRRLGQIRREVSLTDFDAAFRRLMAARAWPLGSASGQGVQVLDAMAARGIPFRALYILGLNEKVFPRHIQEDAFLRDRVRRLLEVDLGFKIQEKLAGYDEERLLFYLLCNSTREQVTLLYQRADDQGRALVPSVYLSEVQRALGESEVRVPRRLTKKFEEVPQYRSERLTPAELAIKLLLERRVPQRLLREAHPSGLVIERGLQTLHALDRIDRRLGPHDGITGPLTAFWQAAGTRGLSPSALEGYTECPFRYFARHVLRLDPLPLPEMVGQVEPVELGTLAHRILRRCFETLRERGYFSRPSLDSEDPFATLTSAARAVFAEFAQSHPTGYPLVWELYQEQMIGFLREVLEADLAELAQEGWEPILFEHGAGGTVTVPLPDGVVEFPVSGRLDRVDWSPSRNRYRIIDYKYKSSREPHTLDKNLTLGAVRGRRLQPALYLRMVLPHLRADPPNESRSPTCDSVWFYYMAPNWDRPLTRIPFPGDAWTADLQEPMARGIGLALNGIRAGQFFILEEKNVCERCDYRLLCRRTHQPTAWRARMDRALVRPVRDLRRVNLPQARPGPATPGRTRGSENAARPSDQDP